MLEKTSS
ncbi:hypothetical protein YPPY46_3904, partial [Yersinia pestis PY-46]